MQYTFPFEKLRVWQESRMLALAIYKVTSTFPEAEKFGIVNQMRRASVSIASNIAEGASRTSKKDQAHFSLIAYGSLTELLCQAGIANDLSFMSNDDYSNLRDKIEDVSRMLVGLRRSQLGG
jgi:four helix bundle protein